MRSDRTEPAVAMMLAMDKNKLIGKSGGMPWHIPGEQIYFKAVTLGKPILMGRVTYDSIGKPLPGRPNIVITRNADWQAEGVHVCTSLNAGIELARQLIRAGENDTNRNTAPNSNARRVLENSTTGVADDVADIAEQAENECELVVIGGAALCREAMPLTSRVYLTLIDNEYDGDVWLDSFDWDDWHVEKQTDLEHDGLRYSYFVLERKPD